jgi:hypothetical protein
MASPDDTDKPDLDDGAPTVYSLKRALRICEHLCSGLSIREIVKLPGMPHRATIYRWLAAHPEFRDAYRASKEIGLDELMDETLAEATSSKLSPERAQLARLAWDARKWHLSKLNPKKYGDTVRAEISGADGSPVTLQALPTLMTPIQVETALRDLISKAEAQMGLADARRHDPTMMRIRCWRPCELAWPPCGTRPCSGGHVIAGQAGAPRDEHRPAPARTRGDRHRL